MMYPPWGSDVRYGQCGPGVRDDRGTVVLQEPKCVTWRVDEWTVVMSDSGVFVVVNVDIVYL